MSVARKGRLDVQRACESAGGSGARGSEVRLCLSLPARGAKTAAATAMKGGTVGGGATASAFAGAAGRTRPTRCLANAPVAASRSATRIPLVQHHQAALRLQARSRREDGAVVRSSATGATPASSGSADDDSDDGSVQPPALTPVVLPGTAGAGAAAQQGGGGWEKNPLKEFNALFAFDEARPPARTRAAAHAPPATRRAGPHPTRRCCSGPSA